MFYTCLIFTAWHQKQAAAVHTPVQIIPVGIGFEFQVPNSKTNSAYLQKLSIPRSNNNDFKTLPINMLRWMEHRDLTDNKEIVLG